MSEPKVTLAKLLQDMRSQPTTPEFDLALQDFLDLPDAEQKAILFRVAVQDCARIDWLFARLQK